MGSSIRKWNKLTLADIMWTFKDEVHGNEHSNTQVSDIVKHAIRLLKKRQGNVFSASRLKYMMWG